MQTLNLSSLQHWCKRDAPPMIRIPNTPPIGCSRRCPALVAAALLLAIGSGGCAHDISQSPMFRPLVGKCFTLREDMFLWGAGSDDLLLLPVGAAGVPESVEAWKARGSQRPRDPRDSGVVGVVPAGTRLKILRLIYDEWDSGNPNHPYAVILDGEFGNKTANVDVLMDGSAADGPPEDYHWRIKEQYAVPWMK